MRISKLSSIVIVTCAGILLFLLCNAPRMSAQDASASAAATSSSSAKTSETEFGDGVTVELVSVTRGDNDLTIKFKYANTGSKTVEFYKSNYGHDNIAALVYYIDPKNKKKYTAIKDAEGKPLASLGENIKLEAGGSKPGWVKLPAPPADTTAITVVLPGAPPFEKVPITAQ